MIKYKKRGEKEKKRLFYWKERDNWNGWFTVDKINVD